MTRGKIILIQGDMQVYVTCEFSGDMYPNMHGEDVLEYFKNGFFQNFRGYDYIEYFIYKLDYGCKYEVGMVTDENGQDIDIHTPDLLYDFISNNSVICQKEV